MATNKRSIPRNLKVILSMATVRVCYWIFYTPVSTKASVVASQGQQAADSPGKLADGLEDLTFWIYPIDFSRRLKVRSPFWVFSSKALRRYWLASWYVETLAHGKKFLL